MQKELVLRRAALVGRRRFQKIRSQQLALLQDVAINGYLAMCSFSDSSAGHRFARRSIRCTRILSFPVPRLS
jgi:hypothetical protein